MAESTGSTYWPFGGRGLDLVVEQVNNARISGDASVSTFNDLWISIPLLGESVIFPDIESWASAGGWAGVNFRNSR